MNSRAVLWGGALGIVILVVAAMVLPFVYVALALAVLLLIALVVANRMREASDADREADNDESTARLGTLLDERDDDYEPYDSSAFDSLLVRPDERTSEPEAPTYDDAPYEETSYEETSYVETSYEDTPVTYEDAPAAYEEFSEPTAEWTTSELQSAEPVIAFEEYTGPSRTADRYDYEAPVGDEPYIDESIIDEVDASSVLADEGIIDESKVTTAETILAASQVSRFEPETITAEESNEETREILGRVAALLAKYE